MKGFYLALILFLTAGRMAQAQVTWSITYQDAANTGFLDPVLGAARQQALTDVTNYIGSVLGHTGTIELEVNTSLNNPASNTLASAGPLAFQTGGFTNGLPFSHATTGIDPLGGEVDATMQVNFGHTYYLGADESVPAGEIDFRTVLLHELTHVLAVVTMSDGNGDSRVFNSTVGGPDAFTQFDSLLYRGPTDTDPLFPGAIFDNVPADLISNDIWFRGPAAMALNGGNPLQINAPSPFSSGSSLSHFQPGTDSIMVPSLGTGVARRTYSSLDFAVLTDVGWTVVPEPGTSILLLLPALAVVWRRRT